MANSNWLTDYVEDITNDTVEKMQDAVEDFKKEFFPLQVENVKEIYREVISDFYNEISENDRTYMPRGSLYRLFSCTTNYKCLNMDFHPELFKSRTGYAGEDGLYTTVFKEGWHGGARHNGGMFYRTPIPYFTYWGKEATRSSMSPYEKFKERWYLYEDTTFESDLRRILNKHIDKI